MPSTLHQNTSVANSTEDFPSTAGKATRPTARPPLLEAHADVALSDINDVCGLIRMSASWIHGEVSAGRFPQPLRFGPRCTRWKIADVRQWLIDRAAQPQANATKLVIDRATKASRAAAAQRAAAIEAAGAV